MTHKRYKKIFPAKNQLGPLSPRHPSSVCLTISSFEATLMSEPGTCSSGRPSWIVFFACCIVSFLVGRNTAVPLFQFQPSSSDSEEIISEAIAHCPVCDQVVNITCPVCEPCQSLGEAKTSEPNRDENVFDKSIAGDPTKAVEFINKVCKSIIESSTTPQGKMLGIPIIIFCHKHTLTYRRGLGYEWDNAASPEQGYYTGKRYEKRSHDLPPFQMDVFQYTAIHAIIASIPAKPIKDELEITGNLMDKQSNYNSWTPNNDFPRGVDGPRVLFWGCGSDTPMHALLMEYLGGNITFIDNNPEYIDMCKKSHPDIRLVAPVGSMTDHTALIETLVPSDGSGLDTDDVNDPLTESQWMPKLSGIELEQPWDVIVIDGPAQALGRSQPLYMAKRLAQSYTPNHYTHIFLHDASRRENCVIANAIMGHDPSVYMGNTLPRKGLKHWRVPGRNRKLPATDNGQS